MNSAWKRALDPKRELFTTIDDMFSFTDIVAFVGCAAIWLGPLFRNGSRARGDSCTLWDFFP